MIINGKYVDYTLASLLKEKGFDEEIETLITPENKVYFLDENSVTNLKHIKIRNSNTNPYSDDVSCPDLWDAIRWLRNECGLHICVDIYQDGSNDADGNIVETWTYWDFMISSVGGNIIYDNGSIFDHNEFKSYEDCVEFAIKYCLENLMNK